MPTLRATFAAASSRLLLAAASAATGGAAFADGMPGAAPAAGKGSTTSRTVGGGASASPWVAAVASKANGSGIRLHYRVAPAMQPGQPGSVELRFSGISESDARAEWRAPAGSVMTDSRGGPASASNSASLPAGQTTTVQLQVTPAADGRAWLDVFTSQGGRSSAQQIPLQVGSGTLLLKREGTVMTTPSGERIISLPSQPK